MLDQQKIDVKSEITKQITIISQKRCLFLIIFMLATITGIIYAHYAKKMYKSSAIILVEKEKIINPLMRGLAVSQTQSDRLRTIRELILSRSRLLQVTKKLDLDLNIKTPLELELLITNLRNNININLIGKNLYRISYEGDNPEVVKNVTNTICNLFIEENLGATRGAARDAYGFIESQLETYKKKLEDSEDALRLFKEKNLEQTPGRENIYRVNLEKYKNLLDEAETELKVAQIQKNLLENQLSNEKQLIVFFSSENDTDTDSPSPLDIQLTRLNFQLNDLLTQYTEKYPDVIRLKKQIEETKQRLSEKNNNSQEEKEYFGSESTTEGLNPMYQLLREDLAQITIQIDVLNEKIKEYKEKVETNKYKVESIPKQEQELAKLKRGYDVNLQIYQTLLSKLEEARISRELEFQETGDNFQIIDTAQMPLIPSWPNKPLLILLGMALGLVIAYLIIFMLHKLDTSIMNMEDARKHFDCPVLVGIPVISSDKDIWRKKINNLIFFSITGIFVASVFALVIKESYLFLSVKKIFSSFVFFR